MAKFQEKIKEMRNTEKGESCLCAATMMHQPGTWEVLNIVLEVDHAGFDQFDFSRVSHTPKYPF